MLKLKFVAYSDSQKLVLNLSTLPTNVVCHIHNTSNNFDEYEYEANVQGD